jgi:DNA-binding IclR family transcriptional regulator
VAALSITGPSSRLTKKRLLHFLDPAARAAHGISVKLGYSGDDLVPGVEPA